MSHLFNLVKAPMGVALTGFTMSYNSHFITFQRFVYTCVPVLIMQCSVRLYIPINELSCPCCVTVILVVAY